MCIEPGSQRGITLIEQIVFMLIVSVGVVGLVSTMSSTVAHSADPQVTKQLAVIAESLLAEVAQQPMTWCDPDDASAFYWNLNNASSNRNRNISSQLVNAQISLETPRQKWRGVLINQCTEN
jgi:Tfp pilus assembly protein PilV